MNRYTIFGYEWHMGEKKILSRVDPGGEWCQVSDVEAELREAFEAGVCASEDGIAFEDGGTIGGAFDSWLKSREGKK
jgi:hypothetical protein